MATYNATMIDIDFTTVDVESEDLDEATPNVKLTGQLFPRSHK